MCKGRAGAGPPTPRHKLASARVADRRRAMRQLAYLPLTLVLVSLFTLAIAASSSPLRTHHQLSRTFESAHAEEAPQSFGRLVSGAPESQGRRSASNSVGANLGLVYGEPQAGVNYILEHNGADIDLNDELDAVNNVNSANNIVVSDHGDVVNDGDDDDDDDDEKFLRRLKAAGDYLEEKLAARRERERQLELGARLSSALLEDEAEAVRDNTQPQQQTNSADLFKYLLLLDKAQVSDGTEPSEAAIVATAPSESGKRPPEELAAKELDADEADVDKAVGQRQQVEFTTLLEDELRPDSAAAASERPPETSTATYGKLVLGSANGTESSPPTPARPTNATSTAGGSLFHRAYNKLAYYLPFLNQLNVLRSPAHLKPRQPVVGEAKVKDNDNDKDKDKDKDKHESEGEGEDKAKDKREDDKRITGTGEAGKQPMAGDKTPEQEREGASKARVSMTLSKKTSHSEESRGRDQSEADDEQDNDQRGADSTLDSNSRNLKVEVEVDRDRADGSPQSPGREDFVGQFGAAGRVQVSGSKRLSVSLTPGEELELAQMVSSQGDGLGPSSPLAVTNFNHLIRQPSLVVPLASVSGPRDVAFDDNGARNEDARGGGESLLGRYIYAPTQHYYLNAVHRLGHGYDDNDDTNNNNNNNNDLVGSQSQLSTAASLRPSGSQRVAALNVAQPIKSSTNDLYFLVMVGAFCMMAMAVVLAAGAFAYRVQQQRKSSQDTDYPTYGVVGPNNMAGKCGGAAAFMGGYFGGAPGAGLVHSGPAAKCVGGLGVGAGGPHHKHLADLYASGLDSGLASSVDKCSTNSSASSGHAVSHSNSASTTATNSTSHSHSHANSNTSNNNNNSTARHAHQVRQAEGGAQQPAGGNQDAARMYHYQHQKQQMIISAGAGAFGKRHTSASDLDSDEDNDDGSYTVYECPGLASAHEMEIKNPLFHDDHSP